MAQIKYTDRGKMSELATFYDPGTDPDPDTAELTDPVQVDSLSDIPAAFNALSGAESRKAQSITSEVTSNVVIPGTYKGVESRMVLEMKFRSGDVKRYQILASWDPDGAGVETRILCVERS